MIANDHTSSASFLWKAVIGASSTKWLERGMDLSLRPAPTRVACRLTQSGDEV